jgi:predicted metal-dependent hydrolase
MLHLTEPTHSERFIKLLNKHQPGWQEARAELNELPLGAENWREPPSGAAAHQRTQMDL